MASSVYSGGCQCGAVRFRAVGHLEASICHCRMCQKAFGSYFAPLVSLRNAQFEWTRGQPMRFASSNMIQRGFCAACGTPLTYEAADGVAVAAGAFDNPAAILPVVQYGLEGQMPFFADLHALPGTRTEDDAEMMPFLDQLVSHQHPDHDTRNSPE